MGGEEPRADAEGRAATGRGSRRADLRSLRVAIVYILLAVAAYQVSGWLFHHIRDFLGMLFLAWLASVTIEPVVDRLERTGMRRGLGTGLVLFGTIVFAIGFIAIFGALLAEQLAQLLGALP